MTPVGAPAARPRRMLRLLRIALVGVAAYLVLANALINSPLLEPLVNRKPERFQMDWQGGWMLWPGRITLTRVTLGGQARSTAWEIGADRARGRIALWPLLRRELRFTWIEADAPRVSVRQVEPALPTPPHGERALRLVFDQVRVDSTLRLDVGDATLEGLAQAEARWHQQLRGGPFELLPSRLHLQQARVLHGGRVLVHDATIDAAARIDAHRRREHPGAAILDLLVAELRLDADAFGLVASIAEDMQVATRTSADSGRIEARLDLDHGLLAPGSALDLRLPLAVTAFSGLTTDGEARLALRARDDDLALALDLPPIPDLIQRASARLVLASRRLPLPPWPQQLARLDGDIELDSKFPSLAAIRPLFRRLQDFELEGRGEVKGRIRVTAGHLAPGTALAIRDAEFGLSAYAHRFQGAAHARADIEPGDGGEARLVASVVLDRFDLAPAGKPDAVLGSGRDLRLELAGTGQMQTLADSLDVRLRFRDARLPDLARFNRYLPPHGVKLLAGRGSIDADMRMQVAENRSGGTFLLRATEATLGLGELVLRGNLLVDAHLAAASLAERQFRLPGTRIALQHVGILRPESETTRGWWGVAELKDGLMDFEQPMALAVDAQVKLRDVAPLLSVFAQRRQFPTWIRRLIDAGEADASARLQRQGECLVVDDMRANNDRFDLEGRIRYCGEQPSGQLHARWGVLGVGVDVDNGQRQFRLKGAKKWFEAQPGYVRAAN
ncbi:MAG TPA: hypothetical protein PK361_00355 [Chiayiivirga sp.]|nr:hypothetical protein [Chiayiivirga sp.]HRQ34051.1 hypothetical protein [Chiayiivirga sp.]